MAEETTEVLETVEDQASNTETGTKEEKTFTQAELDKIVQERVGRAERDFRKTMESQLEQAQSEGERLAKLTKAEREQEAAAKRLAEIEKREASLAERELSFETRDLLASEGLPVEFLGLVRGSTAEEIKEQVANVRKVFDEAVEKRVNERLAQKPARTGNASGAMTKAEILAIPDNAARQKAISDNIHLFKN